MRNIVENIILIVICLLILAGVIGLLYSTIYTIIHLDVIFTTPIEEFSFIRLKIFFGSILSLALVVIFVWIHEKFEDVSTLNKNR